MEINQVITLLLDTIEMSLALFIGIFFLLNRKKNNTLIFLGIYLIASGLSSVASISEIFNIHRENTYLNLLPFTFFWLMPSLLYIYVEKNSSHKMSKFGVIALFTSGIEFIINTIIFFLPIKTSQIIVNSLGYGIFEFLGIIYGLIIVIFIFIKTRKHSEQLKNQYSSLEHRELKWINQMMLFIILFIISLFIFPIFISGFSLDSIVSIFSIFITSWVAYNGLLQQRSFNLINNSIAKLDTPETTKQQKEKSVTTNINIQKHKNIFLKIENIINNESLYLNPDLTITHIAEKISEHPRLVSTSINLIQKENFNTYINRFRVERAKNLLLSNKANRLNIEGIGLESGFKSNSSFYGAFRKQLNMTPLNFIKSSSLN